MENAVEMTDANLSPIEVTTSSELTMPGYTADDIAKAREQEKAKLYPQLEKMKEGLSGETENQEFVDVEPVETSESVQLNLGSANLDPHL